MSSDRDWPGQHLRRKRMSWSFAAIGSAPDVLSQAVATIASTNLQEPEQSLKIMAQDILQRALTAFPDGAQVDVRANGSMSEMKDGMAKNSLNISISPL